jgi:hypothetical protein
MEAITRLMKSMLSAYPPPLIVIPILRQRQLFGKLSVNQLVAGSSPAAGANFKKYYPLRKFDETLDWLLEFSPHYKKCQKPCKT